MCRLFYLHLLRISYTHCIALTCMALYSLNKVASQTPMPIYKLTKAEKVAFYSKEFSCLKGQKKHAYGFCLMLK